MRGLIFDKDGTLYDFNATWGAWSAGLIDHLAAGDPGRAAALADRLGYDADGRRFRPGAIVIAHTARDVARAILPLLPGRTIDDLVEEMNARAMTAPQVEAADLPALFAALHARGLRMALVTNDAEAPARAHLTRSGILGSFDFIAGFDSGHGAKPAPAPLLAAASAMGLAPADCAMIGDSTHDLIAGRAAGMTSIGVLTGPAPAAELAPHADHVLPSVAALPDWLDRPDATAGVA